MGHNAGDQVLMQVADRIVKTVRASDAAARMGGADRTVLLRHFSELSYREIGGVLDLDEKTVKSRLFEARQRLRAMLPEI